MFNLKWVFICSTALTIFMVFALTAQSASAASYKQLKSKGFTTSKLTQNAGGTGGWILRKENEKYFCKIKVLNAYSGKRIIMLGYTGKSSGPKIDRQTFEAVYKQQGGKLSNIPKYSNLKAGRIKSHQVGSCLKQFR